MAKANRFAGMYFLGKANQMKAAFAAATAPFHEEVRTVEKDAAKYQKLVDAGKAVWEEITDDGEHYDYGSALGERRDDAMDALMTLRKAFTLLIYHQWERTAQRWSGVNSPNHEKLVKASQADGISLDEPALELLRLLVNTLKHNSIKCGPILHRLRPDLFEKDFDPISPHPLTGRPLSVIDWADRIVLTDVNIEEFFEIVSRSVPR
jgi:hypothetical protein